MRITNTRVYFRVLEGLSSLEGAREELSEEIGQPVYTGRLMVVQLKLVHQASECTLDLLLVGIGEGVPVNIRQDERFRDVIVLIFCLKWPESTMLLPSGSTHD